MTLIQIDISANMGYNVILQKLTPDQTAAAIIRKGNMGHKSKEVVDLAQIIHEHLDKQNYNVKPLMFSSIEDEIAIPIVTNTKKYVITVKKVH